MNKLPNGYRIIEVRHNSILVGLFDFGLQGKEAEEEIVYEGDTYTRGSMECIPRESSGSCCSCREYVKVVEMKDDGLEEGNFKKQLAKLLSNHDGMMVILNHYNLSEEVAAKDMIEGFLKRLPIVVYKQQ